MAARSRSKASCQDTLEERVVRIFWQQKEHLVLPSSKVKVTPSQPQSPHKPTEKQKPALLALPTLLHRGQHAQIATCGKLDKQEPPEFFSVPPSLDATPSCGSFWGPPEEHPVAGPLNAIVEHLWPRVSAYANQVIMRDVQPAVQAALPKALHGLHFDPERCHLGHQPLVFRELEIKKEPQLASNGAELENLVFKMGVEWLADCSVVLNFAGAAVGIRGLSFRGELMLKLVGLRDQPPFFQGIRASFANPPDMDLVFQGTAKGILNCDVIKHKILDVISKQISNKMVLPNCFGYSIVPDADIFCIKNPLAQGTLTLTVWGARNLLPMDVPVCSWFGSLNSDPYVVVTCGGYTFRSPTKYKTLSPNFSFSVTVPIFDALRQRVRLELWDEDLMSSDDFMGKVSLAVDHMIHWGSTRQVTRELLNEERERGKNGSITLSAVWRPAVRDAASSSQRRAGLVFAGVESASKVPCLGDEARYWIVLRCTGLDSNFGKGPHETGRLAPFAVAQKPAEDKGMPLNRKIELLRHHGLSEATIAEVLDTEVDKLRDCADHHGRARHEVRWHSGFELPVTSLNSSELIFELHGKSSSTSEKLLGTYRCQVKELAAAIGESGQEWRTVKVKGCCAELTLKLSCRALGEAALLQQERIGNDNFELSI
eukprot:TRINITY_DN13230_c0_g2_i1.p1 TRINITY_DN13230_c0_g2~~TRINITY_DN13230_c0_g2_i1.p1  ORF type:complete len:655 (-),score=136.94 TRINITY_DN13230_c0_g2_i1:47-2011(-)